MEILDNVMIQQAGWERANSLITPVPVFSHLSIYCNTQ